MRRTHAHVMTIRSGMERIVKYRYATLRAYMVIAAHRIHVHVTITRSGTGRLVIFLFATSPVQMVATARHRTIAHVHRNGLVSTATRVCIIVCFYVSLCFETVM